jgi:hypothetical protein
MNYYGYLLRPDLLDAAAAGQVIKRALSRMYAEGRFLGCFTDQQGGLTYVDQCDGNVDRFEGLERIATADGTVCYQLRYHGGRIAG